MSILDKLIDVDTWSYHMHGGYWTREVLDSNVFISAKNELAALRAANKTLRYSIWESEFQKEVDAALATDPTRAEIVGGE